MLAQAIKISFHSPGMRLGDIEGDPAAPDEFADGSVDGAQFEAQFVVGRVPLTNGTDGWWYSPATVRVWELRCLDFETCRG